MRAFGLSSSMAGSFWSLPLDIIFRPNPASTPRKVLSMRVQPDKSSTKYEHPFCFSSLSSVLKSMLEVKFARPVILMQANCSPTNTDILAEGVAMVLQFTPIRSPLLRRGFIAGHNLHQSLL